MGHGAPRASEGTVGDITVRELTTVGLRAYIKTDSGWYDINSLIATYQPKWTDLALNTADNWARKSSAYDVPGYLKDTHGFVHLRGAVGGGDASSDTIATLPPGFRPTYIQYRLVLDFGTSTPASSNVAILRINTSGVIVQIESGEADGVILDGISFFAGKKATSIGAGSTANPNTDQFPGGFPVL